MKCLKTHSVAEKDCRKDNKIIKCSLTLCTLHHNFLIELIIQAVKSIHLYNQNLSLRIIMKQKQSEYVFLITNLISVNHKTW